MKKVTFFIFILLVFFVGLRFFFKNLGVTKAYFVYSKVLDTITKLTIDTNLNIKPILIAHAGGYNKSYTYTNTLEAFNTSLLNGFNYFEADFITTSDGHYVSVHDWKNITGNDQSLSFSDFNKIRKSKFGTLLQMEELVDWVLMHHVYLITDGKVDNIQLLTNMIAYSDSVKKYIIPQTYTFEETIVVKKMGFDKIIFTNYKAGYPLWMLNTIWKSGLVWAITIPSSNRNILVYKFILAKNTRLFMHTINEQSKINALFDAGVYGFYTDWLKP